LSKNRGNRFLCDVALFQDGVVTPPSANPAPVAAAAPTSLWPKLPWPHLQSSQQQQQQQQQQFKNFNVSFCQTSHGPAAPIGKPFLSSHGQEPPDGCK